MTRYIVYYDVETLGAFINVTTERPVKVVGRGRFLSFFVIETDDEQTIEELRKRGLRVEEVVEISLIKPIEVE